MLDWWTEISLGLWDFLVGWSLSLPSDITLFAVAVGTSLLLTATRLFTTNQNLLRRTGRDRKRLGLLFREAKTKRNREAVERYRTTKAMIAMKRLKAEGLPLLVTILPVATLATWCFYRLEFHPPTAGERVEVVFYGPVSTISEAIHVLPRDELTVDRYVQPIEKDITGGEVTNGRATWVVAGSALTDPHKLTFRFRGRTFEHDFLVGQRTYSEPVKVHDPDGPFVTELRMRQVRLLGIVPGIPQILLPPWLVAYLIIVIPFVFILRSLLRIY